LAVVAAYPRFIVDERTATLAAEAKRKNLREQENVFLETIEEGAVLMA
jgi:hypothetical protein